MKSFEYLGYAVTVSDSGYVIKRDGEIVEEWSEPGSTSEDYEILSREVIDGFWADEDGI